MFDMSIPGVEPTDDEIEHVRRQFLHSARFEEWEPQSAGD
jgi:hypothetical protein